ncbi:MAG: adenosylmethionine--8-amino-7-oxononanoate transaminase [Lentisphaerae bacterium]|nr:MAG: adenosylmethionine--8-amino-7-oxononanoate transaminase [Lentisphaerota bacterium]
MNDSKSLTPEAIIDFDRTHLWHPYTSMTHPIPAYPVKAARGAILQFMDGREVIDGMASWWCVIHGYSHPHIIQAIQEQAEAMAHVMFGGLTHEPAVRLGRMLLQLLPSSLQYIFYADSGSVSVEVALKMAIQYWHAVGRPKRHRFLTIRRGYHGDTFGAMSVCDPENGMHHLFTGFLPRQIFAPAPQIRPTDPWDPDALRPFEELAQRHHEHIAAVILEPIVQGAGGMRFYHPEYLRGIKRICREHDFLLIFDEIATGFGRTGSMFAAEKAGVEPDIMCIGKALTGGTMTLAATIANRRVVDGLDAENNGVFMHGPTFMANPLACRAAIASIQLLTSSPWQQNIQRIERHFSEHLLPLKQYPAVADARVLGAIGVLEFNQPLDVSAVQKRLIRQGVWLRPFGKLLYSMPPYTIDDDQLARITSAMASIAASPQ